MSLGQQPGHRRDVDDAALPLGLHDRRYRLRQLHRPGQVDRHDLVPHPGRQTVKVVEGDRLVVGGVVDEDVEPAELRRYRADHRFDRRGVGDVAGEGSGLDLVARCQLAGDGFRLFAALCVHDGDVTPCFASAWQICCPSPPLPPVTSATAPL